MSGVVLAGGIAELTIRIFDLSPHFEPTPGAVYRITEEPGLKYALVAGAEYLGTLINSQGMRDIDRSVQKPPNTFRIACIGDSVTFGLYAQMGDTYPARLEDILNIRRNGKGPKFELLNFGVTGYNISQIAATLRQRAIKFSPDLILYGYCLNDPSTYSLEFALLRGRTDARKRRYLDEVMKESQSLALHSHLYRVIFYAWTAELQAWGFRHRAADARPRRFPPTPAGRYNQLHEAGYGGERLLAGFESIKATAKEWSVPVVLVVFPLLDQLENYCCADLHAKVGDEARKHGFHVIDMLEPLRQAAASSKQPINVDELHLTAAGHDAVAAYLAASLTELGLLPDP